MKLNKEYILHPYSIVGTKRLEEKKGVSESSLTLRLLPESPSVFLNFQRIKMEREILYKGKSSTPYEQFIRESASILNSYELEFDSDKIPFQILDHTRIWKQWLGYVEIMSSKYAGEEVDQELSHMTLVLGDEKKLRPILLNDYPIKELYGRELHKIKFDNSNRHIRDWHEMAFSQKMLFRQEYQLNITSQKDTLRIKGHADLKQNKNQIMKICDRSNINFEHIKSIEQDTIYSGANIALIPDKIETRFTLQAAGGLLQQETITLIIKKA